MKCEEIFDLLVSLGGRRVPCKDEAAWAVKVNPPRDGNDGTVKLCEFHNRVDYVGLSRQSLGKSE